MNVKSALSLKAMVMSSPGHREQYGVLLHTTRLPTAGHAEGALGMLAEWSEKNKTDIFGKIESQERGACTTSFQFLSGGT